MEEVIRRFEELLWEEDAPEGDAAEELYRALEPCEGDCFFGGISIMTTRSARLGRRRSITTA